MGLKQWMRRGEINKTNNLSLVKQQQQQALSVKWDKLYLVMIYLDSERYLKFVIDIQILWNFMFDLS